VSPLISGNNQFGFDLSTKLYEEKSPNSIWISPFSITSCFSLIFPGANGNTRSQISNTLHYPTNNNDITGSFFAQQTLIEDTYNGSCRTMACSEYGEYSPSIIGIANRIWIQQGLNVRRSFLNAVDMNNGDNNNNNQLIVDDFDFTFANASVLINEWVDENTNGLIPTVFPEGTDLSHIVLMAANAIYLNGSFTMQFNPTKTSVSPFYATFNDAVLQSESGKVADCHLMHQTEDFLYHADGDYQYLKFHFNDEPGNDLFVMFVLPINNALYSTNNAQLQNMDVLLDVIANQLESTLIALALPKISITATYELNNALQNLGMVDAFDANAANFRGITNTTQLSIDFVIHKTMIEMDEKGLVAAAVTVIGAVATSVISPPPVPVLFRADHAFQMYIIDGTHDNTVLFMGQINDPGIPEGSEAPYDENTPGNNNDIWFHDESDVTPPSSSPATTDIRVPSYAVITKHVNLYQVCACIIALFIL
jgi:serpin B